MIKQTIHLCGFLKNSEDGLMFENTYVTIADRIASKLDFKIETTDSKHQPEDDYQTSTSINVPRVFIKLYMSDNKISLEEAEEKQILYSLGYLY